MVSEQKELYSAEQKVAINRTNLLRRHPKVSDCDSSVLCLLQRCSLQAPFLMEILQSLVDIASTTAQARCRGRI
jgi:hypothetical protein